MAKIENQSKVTTVCELPDNSTKSLSVSSNVSETENMTTSFLKIKEISKEYGTQNDEVELTLTLTNQSDYTIFNVYIIDTIGPGATFKQNSLMIDDVNYLNEEADLGFYLPDTIDKGKSVVIKYKVVLDEQISSSVISFASSITYSVNEVENLTEISNRLTLNVVNNLIKIDKKVSKSAVVSGDRIKYDFVISNEGEYENSDIFFVDELPNEVEFVEGSVIIDGVSEPNFNPINGFEIKDLQKDESVTISFEVIAV